jgi:hypothetical protein
MPLEARNFNLTNNFNSPSQSSSGMDALRMAGAASGNPLAWGYLGIQTLGFIGGLMDDTDEQMLQIQKGTFKENKESADISQAAGRLSLVDSLSAKNRKHNIRNLGG